ncbi:MAG: hypothetical protein AAF805_14800, partial [Planctomycetota bacterium]
MTLVGLLVAIATAATAATAALWRRPLLRDRPMWRYGALSVASHLLLVAWFASVRASAPPQTGADNGPSVRVRIVAAVTPTPDPAPAPPPEPKAEPTLAEPNSAEPNSDWPPGETELPTAMPESTPPQPTADPVVESQATVEPQATPIAEPGNAEPSDASATPDDRSPITIPEPTPVEPSPADAWAIDSVGQALPIEPVAADSVPREEPEPSAPPPSFATAYETRTEAHRRRMTIDQGGSDETLDAVAAAVDWLARAQRNDGAWDARRWGAGRETRVEGTDRGGAGGRAETGLTGLALLAMGGAGHTHLAGPYRDHVTAGLAFLLDEQEASGDLAGDAKLFARTYCHSMATFALAEALAVTRDDRLRPGVERAVDHLARMQDPTTGGWRYRPGDRGDMSQMGWVVMALRSAELAGVAPPPSVWRGCERFLATVERGRHGGLACYQPGRPTSPTMTAEAMYCRQILGVAGVRPAAEDEALATLAARPP